MPREEKPTFIAELPLVASLAQDAVMVDRCEAGRRLFNAVLGDGLKALALMRQSKRYQAARAMPKGEKRTKVFQACDKHY